MDNNEKKSFSYTYSAKEQEELKKIREKYAHRKESKIERLRRLDRSVTKKATAVAIVIGVLGTLLLGLGMSLVMTEFSSVLGQYEDMAMFIGMIVGAFGIASISVAFPVYNLVVTVEKKKIAPEIIRLTDELMK